MPSLQSSCQPRWRGAALVGIGLLLGALTIQGMGCAHFTEPSGSSSAHWLPAGPATSSASPGPGAESPADGGGAAASNPPTARQRGDSESSTVGFPFQQPLPDQLLGGEAWARQYANLSPAQCRRELEQAGLPFQVLGQAAPGVATPVRVAGQIKVAPCAWAFGQQQRQGPGCSGGGGGREPALRPGAAAEAAPGGSVDSAAMGVSEGVEFDTPKAPIPYGILDCRLALALGKLSEVLAAHGVSAVKVDNMYRPNARIGGGKRSQHSYGLAIDIFAFTFTDGSTLAIEGTWPPRIGAPVCGAQADAKGLEPSALRLRNLVCDIARAGIFHHLLTPHFDAAHRNHVHLDIKRDGRRYSIE